MEPSQKSSPHSSNGNRRDVPALEERLHSEESRRSLESLREVIEMVFKNRESLNVDQIDLMKL